jgi:TolB protein
VWFDVNQNGLQDPGEVGVQGVTVRLYRGNGTYLATTVTGHTGFYLFYNLEPGDYFVEFVLPDGYVFTLKNVGKDIHLDSDADPVTGRAKVTNLEDKEIDSSWDAGIYLPLAGTCLECPEYLVFQSNRAENNTDIYRSRLDGTEVVRLTDHLAPDIQPVWSFSGESIAFSSLRDGNWEIYRMGKDGGTPFNVTRLDEADDMAPSWSCDWIAFQSNRDGNWEIYKTDPDGLTQIRLTDNAADDVAPNWSPNGQWIAFQSNRDGNWELYVMDAEGNNVRRLTDHAAADRNPSWDINGSWIYFDSDREGQFDIWKINVDTGELVRLTDDPTDDTDPEATPYCEYVFFETDREGNPQVWRMLPSGAQQINVTLGDNGPMFWNDHLDHVTTILGHIPPEPGRSVRLPLLLK